MNRIPKAGDIVQMDGKRAEHLVVENGTSVVEAAGGTYIAIPHFTAVNAKAADPITGAIDAKKAKTYYTEPTADPKKFPFVNISDLVLSATCKIATSKTYTITKMKDVA